MQEDSRSEPSQINQIRSLRLLDGTTDRQTRDYRKARKIRFFFEGKIRTDPSGNRGPRTPVPV